MEHKDKILILTPVKNAERFLDNYFQSLHLLTYPHGLISLGLLESDSSDNTYTKLVQRLPGLDKDFRSASVWRKDFGFHLPLGTPRWTSYLQKERRTVLAKSRNHLLFRALDDEDWVLWLDVDVVEYPHDIIERLLATGRNIVQPHCVTEYGGSSFEQNAWRDKGRYHLDQMRKEGELVKLDAVGGTMLLIKADIHRDGLIFPPFPHGGKNPFIRGARFQATKRDIISLLLLKPEAIKVLRAMPKKKLLDLPKRYEGEIETEGLGIMAHDMGHECWGMPNLEVKHAPIHERPLKFEQSP
jgi:glycosyltransferase involved in cell wall biosynthesis